MRTARTSMAVVVLMASAILTPGAATADVSAGGISSDNLEWVASVPFEHASSSGAAFVGDYMYLTSWKNISIYDISDPLEPQLTAYEPIGFAFENEQVSVSPDGELLLFSESAPRNVLHIYDVSDKTHVVKVAEIEGAGDHTASCILECDYAYGSQGSIIDLRDRANPVAIALAGDENDWHHQIRLARGDHINNQLAGGGAHDVFEYRRGFALVSPFDLPPFVMDVRDPEKPVIVAMGNGPIGWAGERGFLWHGGTWPRGGKDRWVLMQGENATNPPEATRCPDSTQGPFATFDTRHIAKNHTLDLTDTFRMTSGTYTDGRPAANPVFGCSSHWFDPHPDFHNEGVVAIGWQEHGTRLLNVDKDGKISEVGYFMPFAGSTAATYWVTDEIIYAVDLQRGLDILRYSPHDRIDISVVANYLRAP